MKPFLSSLFLAMALSGCGGKSDPKPATPPVDPPAVDNAVYLRVKADWVQPNLKAYVQRSGSLADALTVALPAGAKSGMVEIANSKSVFVAGQTVVLGIGTNDFPVKGTGSVVAELVRAGVVIGGPVTWNNTAPPAFVQASQSAVVEKTLVLP